MKIGKKIGIGVAAVIVLSTVLGQIAQKHDKEVLGPAQYMKFMNSSPEERIIYFYSEIPDENGDLADGYFYKFTVPAGETVFGKVHQGRYNYKIWGDSDSTLLYEYDHLSILEEMEEDSTDSIYIDLSPDSYVTVLGINYLYGGGSFAETMSQATGTDMTEPFIEKIYKGGEPFKLTQIIYDRDELVDYGEKAPKEISYSKMVYALVPVPATVQHKQEALETAARYANEKL